MLYLIAMSLDSGYVFGKNYLSDLGVSQGAWAFNSGVVTAGLMMMVFSWRGIGPVLGRALLARLGAALLALSGLLLVSIGIFTENSGEVHTVVSYAFFLETLVTVAVIDLGLYASRALGMLGPTVSTAALAFGIGLLPFGGTPLVETLAVLDIIAWGVLLSLVLTFKGP